MDGMVESSVKRPRIYLKYSSDNSRKKLLSRGFRNTLNLSGREVRKTFEYWQIVHPDDDR